MNNDLIEKLVEELKGPMADVMHGRLSALTMDEKIRASLNAIRDATLTEVEKSLHHIPMLHQDVKAYPVKEVLEALKALHETLN